MFIVQVECLWAKHLLSNLSSLCFGVKTVCNYGHWRNQVTKANAKNNYTHTAIIRKKINFVAHLHCPIHGTVGSQLHTTSHLWEGAQDNGMIYTDRQTDGLKGHPIFLSVGRRGDGYRLKPLFWEPEKKAKAIVVLPPPFPPNYMTLCVCVSQQKMERAGRTSMLGIDYNYVF